MSDVAAFVLAGGKSSRMGRNKAFLELAGRTLLQRALDLAATVTTSICIVGEVKSFMTSGSVIEDVYPGQGPLAGIHAALMHSTSAINLILAVDLPLVRAEFVKYLLAEASRTSAVVTLARAAGGWQPLCAVYQRDFAQLAERSLRKRKNKIDPLFEEIELRVISEQEMQQLGFSTDMFRNVNTPEEFDRALVELDGV